MSAADHGVEVEGLVVRLDVRVDDPARAAEVAETLSRQAAGFAAEGLVASMIVHPDRLAVSHGLSSEYIDDEDDGPEGADG